MEAPGDRSNGPRHGPLIGVSVTNASNITTREAELARRREYEARREAVAHDAWMAERVRLMLTEGWF